MRKIGTLGRLILGLLIDTKYPIKLIEIKVYQKEILKEFQILKSIWCQIKIK